MKAFKSVCVLALALFPLAHFSLQGAAQPAQAEAQLSACSEQALMCGRCGDGVCVPQCGENATTCPADCAGTSF